MMEYTWKHICTGRELSKTEVMAELDQKANGIAILSGPSGCGKTMLLLEFRCATKKPIFIYSCEQIADSILSMAKAGRLDEGVPVFKNHPLNTMLVIEDFDYYFRGRPDTRQLVYRNLRQLAKNCCIILSGIDLELKMPDLLEFPEAEWYCAARPTDEFWDLYDENGNRISGAFHLRGKPLREGTYHPVVNVLIRDYRGQYLMGQRSADRKSFPLLWEGCGGSVLMGETFMEAGIREAWEELGIQLNPKDSKLIDTRVRIERWGKPYQDILYTYLFELNEITWHPDLAPTKEEVADSRLFTLPEIREFYQTGQLHPDLDYIFDLLE